MVLWILCWICWHIGVLYYIGRILLSSMLNLCIFGGLPESLYKRTTEMDIKWGPSERELHYMHPYRSARSIFCCNDCNKPTENPDPHLFVWERTRHCDEFWQKKRGGGIVSVGFAWFFRFLSCSVSPCRLKIFPSFKKAGTQLNHIMKHFTFWYNVWNNNGSKYIEIWNKSEYI